MTNKILIFNHLRRQGMSRGLALLAALLGTLLLGSVAFAQTGTVYTVSNDASCTAFLSAIGADGSMNGDCYIYSGTLPAADTLTIAGRYTLRPQLGGPTSPNFTNLGVVNISTSASNGLYNAGVFDNRGRLNINSHSQNYNTINNYGTITIAAEFYNNGTINNAGSIICLPGGSLLGSGTFSGNFVPTCDTTPPSVTINQAAGQADPTNSNPVLFNANFSEAVTGFTSADVRLSGTTNLSGATITVSGGPANYTISVGGLTSSGTVIATIAANRAVDKGGNGNTASTSTDNTVNLDTAPPTANPTQSPPPAPSGWNNTAVTVTWNWSDPATSAGAVSGIDPANCTTSSVASGSATVTVTATCKDKAGNTGTATYSVRIDPTAPNANPSQSPAANGAGWNNTDVTVNWNWVFTGAIIDTANCTTSLTSSGEGVLTLSATCKDVALNQRTVPYTVKVDKTAPVVTVTGVSAGTSYVLGSVPTAACSSSDALSGVATQATVAITGGNGDGTGSFTATCSGATDVAGNSAAAVSVGYSVTPPPDTTAPVITPNVVGTLGNNGWYVSDVTISWTVVDDKSAISSQSGCDPVTINADTTGVTFTCAATSSGGSSSESVTIKRDTTAPTISAAASSAPNANGWYNSDVTVQFTCNDNLSGVVSCPVDEVLSSEGSAVSSTIQSVSDGAGNSSAASNVVTVQIDKSAPVITVTGVSNGANYTLGSVPTAACNTADALSGVATQATLSITGGNGDGTDSFTATCSGATDNAGNSAAPVSVTYTVNPPPDTTAPLITPNVVGTLGNNGWYVNDVTVSWSVVDTESTISSQSGCETQNVTSDTVGVTLTCSATSSGGMASQSVTIKRDATAPVITVTGVSNGASYTLGSVPTAACSMTDALSGVATQATVSVTGGNADGTGNFTATCSGATDNAGNSGSASVSYTVSAVVADACTTTALRDDFNRANGGLGSNWTGLVDQSFYKIANNRVDVQLGGPVVWKPTTFGVNQAAFVTLSTLDATGPAQGLLLKVQGGTIPTGGAIAVVYDNLAKAVRVSTLRLNTPTWTVYGNTPATFANGDQLLGCVQANGTVRVYRNNSLLTTVTLNAADQSFFNTKGGKIGLWTVAAFNAFVDDFGGGALTGVVSATLDATIPDELADDGTEITVAENFPTDDTAAPEAGTFANHVFLPQINR